MVLLPAPGAHSDLKKPYRSVVAADGTAQVDITPTSSSTWSVTQVSAELPTAPAGAAASLRVDGVFITAMIPSGDVAAGEPPVKLQPGETMTLEWTGCTPGDVASVLVFYDEIPR